MNFLMNVTNVYGSCVVLFLVLCLTFKHFYFVVNVLNVYHVFHFVVNVFNFCRYWGKIETFIINVTFLTILIFSQKPARFETICSW